jgi:hypothetical protein
MFKSRRDDIFIENQATQHRAPAGRNIKFRNKKDKISKKQIIMFKSRRDGIFIEIKPHNTEPQRGEILNSENKKGGIFQK